MAEPHNDNPTTRLNKLKPPLALKNVDQCKQTKFSYWLKQLNFILLKHLSLTKILVVKWNLNIQGVFMLTN